MSGARDIEVNKIRSLSSRRLLRRQAEHKPHGKAHPPVTEPLPQARNTRLTLNVTTCYVASRQGNWARLGRAGVSQHVGRWDKASGFMPATRCLPRHPVAHTQPWTSGDFRKVKLNLQAKQDLERQDLELYMVHSWGIWDKVLG